MFLFRVDCVGILKLRNADVEARIGVAGSKKKSTRARLVFRVNIPRSDGSVLTLQAPSSPILCSKLNRKQIISRNCSVNPAVVDFETYHFIITIEILQVLSLNFNIARGQLIFFWCQHLEGVWKIPLDYFQCLKYMGVVSFTNRKDA